MDPINFYTYFFMNFELFSHILFFWWADSSSRHLCVTLSPYIYLFKCYILKDFGLYLHTVYLHTTASTFYPLKLLSSFIAFHTIRCFITWLFIYCLSPPLWHKLKKEQGLGFAHSCILWIVTGTKQVLIKWRKKIN